MQKKEIRNIIKEVIAEQSWAEEIDNKPLIMIKIPVSNLFKIIKTK